MTLAHTGIFLFTYEYLLAVEREQAIDVLSLSSRPVGPSSVLDLAGAGADLVAKVLHFACDVSAGFFSAGRSQ
jgi:hypothetical protein